MSYQTTKVPSVRFRDLKECCLRTIENAHLSRLDHVDCTVCGATLKRDGHAWEIERRGPGTAVPVNQPRTTEML